MLVRKGQMVWMTKRGINICCLAGCFLSENIKSQMQTSERT